MYLLNEKERQRERETDRQTDRQRASEKIKFINLRKLNVW